MGSSRFWLKAADEESKSIPHEFPRSHWLKATGQCVLERYLSATLAPNGYIRKTKFCLFLSSYEGSPNASKNALILQIDKSSVAAPNLLVNLMSD